jgi:hypothetical protein
MLEYGLIAEWLITFGFAFVLMIAGCMMTMTMTI